MISISKNADLNYLACVVKCPAPSKHPNADKLEILTIFGGDVIVAKDQYKEEELLVFFPVESCLSEKFLRDQNLYSDTTLNKNQNIKGYFSSNGRVRAVKLREIASQGFLMKVSKIAEYYSIKESIFKLGESFDTVNGDTLVKKYVTAKHNSEQQTNNSKRIPKWIEKLVSLLPKSTRRGVYSAINNFYSLNNLGISKLIVDGNWQFHSSTEHLGKNIFKINPDDDITVTWKLHGTSAIYGNILCKKPFNIFRYIGEKIGLNVENTEHNMVYSSRSIIKNRRDGKFTNDVWGTIASRLNGKIPKNVLVYGEIVGYSSSNKCVQKNYDYGIRSGDCEFFIYRITENTPNGLVYSWDEIEKFSIATGIKHVPVIYKGLAKNIFNFDSYSEYDLNKWRNDFLTYLKDKFLDKPCEFCTTGVVNEGIVIRNENVSNKTALKYKSPSFLLKESADRDKGETNIEEES